MAINHINDTAGSFLQPLLTLPVSQNSQTNSNKIVSSESTNLASIEQNSNSDKHIEQAIEKIQETVNNMAQNLRFSIDEDTGKTVIKVMDAQTQELIRQIPSQEAISIARTLDKVQGLLLDDEA
ncbi:flagellar protein FlaG [Nitrosomonas aestuarii]|uniref:flagellar protein FlaG n=1 Tax=Nitrosomonas aestuarii TaxID=52441 RepID=UPI000D32268B|nr:flagellar protein FlaG [Nitrosomonas aestuarii]PTN13136.1 flagellar protein FlaG [Nitrosomonas aestuarii]